jgi:hypothetical protein
VTVEVTLPRGRGWQWIEGRVESIEGGYVVLVDRDGQRQMAQEAYVTDAFDTPTP